MPTPTYTAVLLLAAGALVAGLLISWVHFRLRTGAEFVPLAAPSRANSSRCAGATAAGCGRCGTCCCVTSSMRISCDPRSRAAESHQTTQASLLAARQAEIATLRERVALMDAEIRGQARSVSELSAREQALATQLHEALERIAGFERDHGLLRIERDELVARTQRLRALSIPTTDDPRT